MPTFQEPKEITQARSMEIQGQPKSGRLVLVVFPFQGHINPMLQLATILHSKGFSITIVHPQLNSPDPSNHPDFTFVPVQDNFTQSNIPDGYFVSALKALNRNCKEPLQRHMEKMLKEARSDDRIMGIIYDMVMYFAQSVADHLKLPGFVFRTSSAATILCLSLFRRPNEEQGYVSLIDAMSQDLGPELQSLKLKNFLTSPGFPEEPAIEARADFTSAMQRSSAIIVNTMHFLEREAIPKVQQYFPHAQVFTIGPFHKLAPNVSNLLLNEDRSCISWLDKKPPKSVIYVSFGSMVSMREKELLEVAWGLANSEQPFLWVIRPDLVPGSDMKSLLPESFNGRIGERGCIVQWAPQKEVLGHSSVGGFWTHCGWNSTLESVCAGVPMLCRPFFGDQPLNARFVCHLWKTGIELEGEFEQGKIVKAVGRLMVDNEGGEMRKRAEELKEMAEACLKEGGSTHQLLNDFAMHCLSR